MLKKHSPKDSKNIKTTPTCSCETVDTLSKNSSEIKEAVRNAYGKYKNDESTPFACSCGTSCCSGKTEPREYATKLGYLEEDVRLEVANGANLGLGCGNPIAIASLLPGETVLDLGSGGGFDCFLAARKVGLTGRVIGVDMTPEMIERAKDNALTHGITNVEFLLGEMEDLPLPDNSIDIVISNCVINLSPDKASVFKEAARVIKPGGRFVISDVIATQEIPPNIQKDLSLYTGCMAGAIPIARLEAMMIAAGFSCVKIEPKPESRSYIGHWAPNSQAEDYVASAIITATKLV
jgi:SAM-dependent methyltransferase